MAFEINNPPPWTSDPSPDNWVLLRDAATAFRKHPETIRRLAVSGTIPSYFDGYSWWVRLDFSPPTP